MRDGADDYILFLVLSYSVNIIHVTISRNHLPSRHPQLGQFSFSKAFFSLCLIIYVNKYDFCFPIMEFQMAFTVDGVTGGVTKNEIGYPGRSENLPQNEDA